MVSLTLASSFDTRAKKSPAFRSSLTVARLSATAIKSGGDFGFSLQTSAAVLVIRISQQYTAYLSILLG